MKGNKPIIIRKVSFTDTFRQIAPGDSATYTCTLLGVYGSACVAVSRLNKASGYLEYEIETPDNGITYTVTRNFKGGAYYTRNPL